jgi:capsid protein
LREQAVQASYDSARTEVWNQNHWANADALDADSANSRSVRQTVVRRSRYEAGSNGFQAGILRTHANYLVRTGPSLQVLTGNDGFNTAVETTFWRWAKAVQLRRKLWCMSHAKLQDGEPLAIMRVNPSLPQKVKLDVVLIETEQCQTPMLPWGVVGYIDGIKFDAFGNPEWYDILPQHPGGQWSQVNTRPEQVPAKWVLHWFKLERAGQHRGLPELQSSLNVGAAGRRWREATIAAAEFAASLSGVLKTQMCPEVAEAADSLPSAWSQMPVAKNTFTALPALTELQQLDAAHPNAQHAEFTRSLISEQGRPKNMPHNIAAADSSNHNFASGRLDFIPWYEELLQDRLDCNDCVMDPLFARWWEFAVLAYGWAADPEVPPDMQWNWPQHPVADQNAQATSNETKLRSGQTTLTAICEEAGIDFEEQVSQMATDYGLPIEKMREILLTAIFQNGNPQQAKPQTQSGGPPDATEEA